MKPEEEIKPEEEASEEANADPVEEESEEAMDKPAEAESDEAMAKPEEEASEETMQQPDEEAAEDTMQKPEEDSSDQSTNQIMPATEQDTATEEPAAETEVDMAAISTCRADCASVYEPCRQTADVRMDACFSSGDAQQCQTTWKDEAGNCISERLECMAKCS
jgi:outer membrane biosynthesis protein TonB